MRCLELSVVVSLSLFVSAPAQDRPKLRDYGRLPLVFEPNQGQSDPAVKFLARTQGGTLFLTEREAVFTAPGAEPVRMRLAHAAKPRAIQGLEPTGGISNYFIGNDPAKWRTNIPNYNRVQYKSVYPGVDLVYYGNPQKLEYDLVVGPGADASAIQLEYDGVESLRVDTEGDLVMQTSGGELRQKRPVAYQETAAGRVEVKIGYRLNPRRRVSFELARYDARRRLVIDPEVVLYPKLLYSTYLGGSGGDSAQAIAVDSSGNAYLTGITSSTNFPTANPLQASTGGAGDAFVTKISTTGGFVVYSTYLGGSKFDEALGIAVDSSGAAYVVGETASTNFPTASAQFPNFGGAFDGFVTKLNATGSALVYSTYLGGSELDQANAIAVDSSGIAYVTGNTYSSDFPTAHPLQASNGGGSNSDAFVAKIASTGVLAYSTYLGGSGFEAGYAIAVDSFGQAYVTGQTSSSNFPTASPFQATYGGLGDAFVTKLNSSGMALVYSTYLGGAQIEDGYGIAVDSTGAAYVTGYTTSANFPTASPLQPSPGGTGDAFVTKFNSAGSALQYSTYLGGSGYDFGYAIALDGADNAYVTGKTASTNFPTNNPIQAAYGGIPTVFVTKIDAAGSSTLYSTYLGGTGGDIGYGIAVDGSGNARVTGSTLSSNFPTQNPLQASNGNPSAGNAFASMISGNSGTAAFRDTSGAIELTSELSTSLSDSGGAFSSDPAAAQNVTGDTFVVARDSSNAIWLNVFDGRTRVWDGWLSAGGAAQGVPAIVAIGETAYIVVRDASNAYWTNTYIRGSGFGGWVNRGGAFSTDPAIGGAVASSTLYLVGKDNFNAIWTAVWLFPTFNPWALQGAVVAGKPSVTVGVDGAAYIAIRDNSNAVWMGRQTGGTFNGWEAGGGSVAADPQVAAAGSVVYATATTASGAVWYNTFNQGTGNNWTGWTNAGGTLSSVTAAASTGPQLLLTGRDSSDQLWWYEKPGAGWKFVGNAGLAAGPLSAAPR